jgi:hypothetical protein
MICWNYENIFISFFFEFQGALFYPNIILLLQLSRFAKRKLFSSVSICFPSSWDQLWKRLCKIWGQRLKFCDLFETLFLLERSGKTSNEPW